jgi:hypothetical protein
MPEPEFPRIDPEETARAVHRRYLEKGGPCGGGLGHIDLGMPIAERSHKRWHRWLFGVVLIALALLSAWAFAELNNRIGLIGLG